jgi:DNA-directed RNA polymerase specialized sigma24 family protein
MARTKAIETLQNDVTVPYEERKFFQFSDDLTEQERKIFSMNYFQGTSREDIAVTFGLSIDQVRDIIRKTLVNIRIQLDKKFDLDPRSKPRRIDH